MLPMIAHDVSARHVGSFRQHMHQQRRRIAEREEALGESEADLAARHTRLAQAAGSARRELLALRADRAKVSTAACRDSLPPVASNLYARTTM